MPKLTTAVPKYRKHRASRQALVTINGKDHYLGPHGTKASRLEYDRLINQWLVTGRDERFGIPDQELGEITVAELINRFRKHCEKRYRRDDGTPTGSIETIKAIMKRLRKRYGDCAASDFRPLALKEFIKSMVDDDCSRTYINMGIGKIKQMFRWGVSEEIVDESVVRRLESVRGESIGSSDARETAPVEPVADAVVEATITHMPEMVRAMVRLQRLTGMRPGEVCNLRECDLESLPDAMLLYRPIRHKTKHKGKKRLIIIGPKARLILAPYLGNGDQYVFSPQRSIIIEMAKRGIKRRAPVTAGDQYTNDSYRRAVTRGCELAYPAPKNVDVPAKSAWRQKHNWSPNQLRHSLATEVRQSEQSLESVAAVLGHANISTSEIYAERNMQMAVEIMKRIG